MLWKNVNVADVTQYLANANAADINRREK